MFRKIIQAFAPVPMVTCMFPAVSPTFHPRPNASSPGSTFSQLPSFLDSKRKFTNGNKQSLYAQLNGKGHTDEAMLEIHVGYKSIKQDLGQFRRSQVNVIQSLSNQVLAISNEDLSEQLERVATIHNRALTKSNQNIFDTAESVHHLQRQTQPRQLSSLSVPRLPPHSSHLLKTIREQNRNVLHVPSLASFNTTDTPASFMPTLNSSSLLSSRMLARQATFSPLAPLPLISSSNRDERRAKRQFLKRSTDFETTLGSFKKKAKVKPPPRLSNDNDRKRFIANYPTKKKDKTLYLQHWVEQFAKEGLVILPSAMKKWVSVSKPTTKAIRGNVDKRGRPRKSTTPAQLSHVLNAAANQIQLGGHTPSFQEYLNTVQLKRIDDAAELGQTVGPLSPAEQVSAWRALKANGKVVTKPDDNCQTIPRHKAGDVRNAINSSLVKEFHRSGPRQGVNAVKAAQYNIHPSLQIAHDETTLVEFAGHDNTHKLLLPSKAKAIKVTAPKKGKGKLPIRIKVQSLMDAQGGNDQELTVMLKDYDVFREEGSNGPVADALQNIFVLRVYGGRHLPPLTIRFIRPGTSEKEATEHSFHNFVRPQIESRRQALAKMLDIAYDVNNLDPDIMSSMTGSDGAGGNLAATVDHEMSLDDEGRNSAGQKMYESFLKTPASGTHFTAEPDVATIYRDHKRAMRIALRLFYDQNVDENDFFDSNKILEEHQTSSTITPNFWDQHEEHQTYKDVMAAVFGAQSTLGFNLNKAKLVARFTYAFVMTRGESFGSERKNKIAFQTTGAYPFDYKRTITSSPQWKSDELTNDIKAYILKPENIETMMEQVVLNGFVTDAWFDAHNFPVSRYGLVEKTGERINRDNIPLWRQTARSLSHYRLSNELAEKEEDEMMEQHAKEQSERRKTMNSAALLKVRDTNGRILLEEIRVAKGCQSVVPKRKINKGPCISALEYLGLDTSGKKSVLHTRLDDYLIAKHGPQYNLSVEEVVDMRPLTIDEVLGEAGVKYHEAEDMEVECSCEAYGEMCDCDL